jgi:predicted ATP-grasp superfamily ATP-dependent carboligase
MKCLCLVHQLVVSLLLLIGCSSLASSKRSVLVLVDSFCEYLSGHAKDYCVRNGIEVHEVISPYMVSILQSQGRDVPQYLQAPTEQKDVIAWARERGLLGRDATSNSNSNSKSNTDENTGHQISNDTNETISSDSSDDSEAVDELCIISESDSGVSTAERMQVALKLKSSNGISPQLRHKYESNERAKLYGLDTVMQKLAFSWTEAKEFLETELWIGVDSAAERKCVIKPFRGVASDGVFLCHDLVEAERAFNQLHQKPQYGGGVNDGVLIQEYADGTEYAVDTVARDGEIKVVALWRYRKLPANGAPFVYQCSELVAVDDDEKREVCEYAVSILQAQDLKWGPTHTEIKFTSDGPRLIEINARWHAQHFYPVCQFGLGYNAIDVTLDAFFDAEAFDAIPSIPSDRLNGAGLILHLISYFEGTVRKINHVDHIEGLPSTILVDIESEVGAKLQKTTDIRTDCGYVLLCHDKEEVVAKDYDTIVKLQETLFEVGGENDDQSQLQSKLKSISEQQQQRLSESSTALTGTPSRTSKVLSLAIRLLILTAIPYILGNIFFLLLPYILGR